jgi:hypothetical protein
MSERGFVKIEVETIGRGEDDLIDILGPPNKFRLTESQKQALRDFMTRIYAVPLSILVSYGRRVYSAIRESSFLEYSLGGGLSVIVYYLNEMVNGIRKISIWAVDIDTSSYSVSV